MTRGQNLKEGWATKLPHYTDPKGGIWYRP